MPKRYGKIIFTRIYNRAYCGNTAYDYFYCLLKPNVFDNMTTQGFLTKLTEQFPEHEQTCRKHVEDYGKILLHVLAGDTINVPLTELLKKNDNSPKIRAYCDFIEMMWREGDEQIINVVEVTILEYLSYYDDIWQNFGKYISSEFKSYINNDVLKNNVAMQQVKVL